MSDNKVKISQLPIKEELDGQEVFFKEVSDNYMRLNRIKLDKKVECDSVVITVMQTYGIDKARIFEVRVY